MAGVAAAAPAFEAGGIAEVMHFAELTSKDLDNLFTSVRGRRVNQAGHQIGLMHTKNIRALALWARTRVQMQDLPVGDNDFTPALSQEHKTKLETVDATEDEEGVKKPSKLNPNDWDAWEQTLIN